MSADHVQKKRRVDATSAMGSLGEFNKAGPFETRLFINNEFVDSQDGSTFATVNPANEEVICQVQEAKAADVDLAVKAARAAFTGPWKDMDGSARRDLMLKLADLIEENVDYLAKIESLDNGKPCNNEGYGSKVDMALCVKNIRYFAGWADKITGKTIPIDGPHFCYTRKEPAGVVGAIIPWNFPALMGIWKLSPILAAGCTVVLKSSEKTPLSALAIAKLIKEAGFPPGVVNIISGYGPSTGEPLVRHPDVDKIAFTGSTAVGKKIQALCAENVKRVTLELGGKSPLIVMADADVDEAVNVAQVGLFLNQGQACCASSRLLVHKDIYDEFVAKSVEKANSRRLLDPSDPNCDQGPQVDKLQFDKVMGYIKRGVEQGAKVVAGGSRHGDKGYYIQPTVFVDIQDSHDIATQEIFGPVMSIFKYDTYEEAIERANATKYGLAAGVCGKDIGKVLKIAHELRAGTVWINTYDIFDAAAPFGGYKESGLGREMGEAALANYLELKTVVVPTKL